MLGNESVVSRELVLERLPTPLEEVRVSAPAPRSVPSKMVGFEERRALGFGHFIDRDLLEKQANRRTSDSPAGIEGIEIYTGTSQTPPQYNRTSGGCGVILIWTRISR